MLEESKTLTVNLPNGKVEVFKAQKPVLDADGVVESECKVQFFLFSDTRTLFVRVLKRNRNRDAEASRSIAETEEMEQALKEAEEYEAMQAEREDKNSFYHDPAYRMLRPKTKKQVMQEYAKYTQSEMRYYFPFDSGMSFTSEQFDDFTWDDDPF